MDPLLLLSDTQIKAEIAKLLPEEKAKFDDFSSFSEDWHSETGKYEPMDQVMKQLKLGIQEYHLLWLHN